MHPMPVARTISLLALVLALAGVRGAKYQVERNAFRVIQPADISGEYDSAIGDFGIPLYGGQLVGRLGFVPSNELGCEPFKASDLEGVDLVLVERGTCFFIDKAWNAQEAGAKGVVVYDRFDQALMTMAMPEDDDRVVDLAQRLKIPTVLVSRAVGTRLKRAAIAAAASWGGAAGGDPRAGDSSRPRDKHEPFFPRVVLDWRESLAHPDDRVEVGFWHTTNPGCGSACLRMKRFVSTFGDRAWDLEESGSARFTPHARLLTCGRREEACAQACVRGGRYCAGSMLSESARAAGVLESDVVEQDLRSVCVHRVLNRTGEGGSWWRYAALVAERCSIDGAGANRYTRKCALLQAAVSGAHPDDVEACVGDPTLDAPLEVAEAELREGRGDADDADSRVLTVPALAVNRDQYRGYLSSDGVMRAVCAGFREGTEPHACLSSSLNEDECASGRHACWKGAGLPTGANTSLAAPSGPFSACHDTFRGYRCECPAGFEGNGRVCTDRDECAAGSDTCDHVCHNTPGSYRCSCRLGFALVSDGGPGPAGRCVRLSSLSGASVALLAAAAAAVAAAAVLAASRARARARVRDEVRSILSDYMPLDDGDAERGPTGAASGPTGAPPAGQGGSLEAKLRAVPTEGGSLPSPATASWTISPLRAPRAPIASAARADVESPASSDTGRASSVSPRAPSPQGQALAVLGIADPYSERASLSTSPSARDDFELTTVTRPL